MKNIYIFPVEPVMFSVSKYFCDCPYFNLIIKEYYITLYFTKLYGSKNNK